MAGLSRPAVSAASEFALANKTLGPKFIFGCAGDAADAVLRESAVPVLQSAAPRAGHRSYWAHARHTTQSGLQPSVACMRQVWGTSRRGVRQIDSRVYLSAQQRPLRALCVAARGSSVDIAFCETFDEVEDALLRRAGRLLSLAQPRVTVGLCGLPGSGKSTAAEKLAERCAVVKLMPALRRESLAEATLERALQGQ